MKKFRLLGALLGLTLFLCACGNNAELVSVDDSKEAVKTLGELTIGESAASLRSYASAEERLSVMTEVAAEGENHLYFDTATGDIALHAADSVFFSTPWDLDTDAKSIDAQKQRMASQVRITYMDSKQNVADIYSFPEAVAKGQYTAQKIENGLQVNMVIGRAEQRTLLPGALPVASFEGVLESLTTREVGRMKAFYKLYDPDSTPENQLALIRPQYPVVDEQPIYVLKNVTDREKAELEGYFSKAEYTFEDMERDLEEVGAEEGETVSPRFEISILYQLKDGELKVSVPTDKLAFDDRHFSLLEIGLLENFAADRCNGEGYLFIPDGSGTVIGFNRDGSKLGNDIRIPVYGYDRALTYTSGYENLMTAALPVYGISSQNGTLMAVIDEGAAMANIVANAGGNMSGYARVGAAFTYSDYDTFEYKDVNTQRAWTIADKHPYGGTYTISYIPLKQGDGYSAMAGRYRERLALDKKIDGNDLKLVVGLYGSVKHNDQVLFVPVKRQVALTTFDDAGVIANEILDSGISNLDLRYVGWTKGGLEGRAFTKASIQGAVGSKSSLKSLSATLKEKQVGLYLDADFTYVGNTGAFDGFSATNDTARMLDKTYAGYNEVRLSSGLMNDKRFLYAVRPSAMLSFFEKFNKSYSKLNVEGLSVGTLGRSLNSDKDNKKGVDRATAEQYVTEILKRASSQYDLITEGANDYVYDYVSCLINAPSSASGYPDADHSVPFLQMVLHGSVDYTTAAVNLSGNYRTEILKAIENGSGLYFELAYRNTDLLKTSDHADLYTVNYATWKDKLLDCYNEVNEAIGDLAGQQMVEHQSPVDGLSRVTYSSGTVIYVNYNDNDVEADGVTVPAGSYVRIQ